MCSTVGEARRFFFFFFSLPVDLQRPLGMERICGTPSFFSILEKTLKKHLQCRRCVGTTLTCDVRLL